MRWFAILPLLLIPSLASAQSLTLQWDANPEPDIQSYQVLIGSSSGVYGAPIDVGKVLSYRPAIDLTKPWVFAVTATNTAGLVSARSAEVQYQPAPPPLCVYAVSPTLLTFVKSASTRKFTITTAASCPWTVTDDASWLSASPTSGTGTATITGKATRNRNIARASHFHVTGGGIVEATQVSGR